MTTCDSSNAGVVLHSYSLPVNAVCSLVLSNSHLHSLSLTVSAVAKLT